jgi:hypothetical protein
MGIGVQRQTNIARLVTQPIDMDRDERTMRSLPELHGIHGVRRLKASVHLLACRRFRRLVPARRTEVITIECDDLLSGQIHIEHRQDLMLTRQTAQQVAALRQRDAPQWPFWNFPHEQSHWLGWQRCIVDCGDQAQSESV